MSKEKLTDEQIIKALENKCQGYGSGYVGNLNEATLNLINRLNNDYAQLAGNYIADTEKLEKENTELKAENERLTRILENKMDTLAKLLEQERKETVEKIFAKIFEDFNIDCGTFSLNMARKRYMNAQVEQTNLALRRRFLQLAEQFGVEIKE